VKKRTHIRKWNVIVLISISIVYGIAIIAVSHIDRYKAPIIEYGLIKHAFAIGNLEADGQCTGFEFLYKKTVLLFLKLNRIEARNHVSVH
jgi:hypothetical protein